MAKSEQNLSAALSLSKMGLPCFPCGRDKRPLVTAWQEAATSDADAIRAWWRKFPYAIPALPTGEKSGFSVIDLDLKNGKDGLREYRSLGLDPQGAATYVRTASGGYHLYFSHAPGIRNSQDKVAPGIDVRGEGGYVIAPGAVIEAGTYCLEGCDLEAAKLLAIDFPPEIREALARDDRAPSPPIQVSPDQLRDPLFAIPNDGPREEWVRILMAVHSGTGGSPEGLDLAQEWSAGYPGYSPDEVEAQWRSFKRSMEGGVTVRTLLREARRCGWEGNIGDLADAFDDDVEAEPVGPIEELNSRYALVRLGGNVAVADFRPNGDIEFLSTGAFRDIFSNRRYGKQRLGAAWMKHPKRRTFEDGVIFDPTGKAGPGTLNLWRGWAVEPDGDASFDLIHEHIVEVIARGNEAHAAYVFSWLSDIVRNPASKPGVALVLKGRKGVGKDTVAEVMKAIVGRRHSAHVPAAERLVGRFNAAFATALLIHVEEAIWGGNRDSKGAVQSLITCPSMPLERKHVDTVQVDSFARLLFTTNEEWAIPATADERRYAVFEVSDHRKGDHAYFDALYRQIEEGGTAGFLSFLLDWTPPPGLDLRRPPQTRGLMEQKISGLRNVERWWYEVLSVGDLPMEDPNEENENWSEATIARRRDMLRSLYEGWMRQRRYQGEIKGPSEFGETLRAICPGVERFRPSADGKRPWCYRFPPLDQCRADFTAYMDGESGDIDWAETSL